jgi:hypothetical protein
MAALWSVALRGFFRSHWPLSTVSFSRSRGRDRDPNTGAGWGLPVVDRIALDRVTAAMDGDYPPHRAEYPRTARKRANLKNFLPMARRLNLLRIPATNANGSCVPVYLSAGGVVPPAPRCRWSV